MKTSTRIIFSIYILCVVAMSAFLIVGTFEPAVSLAICNMVTYLYPFNIWTVVWIVVAALFLIVGICLLFFGANKKKSAKAMVSSVADGSISIAFSTIDELSKRYLSGIDGIIINSVGTSSATPGQVDLISDISMKGETTIPEVTEKIKEELKAYIENYTGLIVGQVKISVTPLRQQAVVPK